MYCLVGLFSKYSKTDGTNRLGNGEQGQEQCQRKVIKSAKHKGIPGMSFPDYYWWQTSISSPTVDMVSIFIIPSILNCLGVLSPAIEVGNLVFVSGQIGRNPVSKQISPDIKLQVKQIFDNLQDILQWVLMKQTFINKRISIRFIRRHIDSKAQKQCKLDY